MAKTGNGKEVDELDYMDQNIYVQLAKNTLLYESEKKQKPKKVVNYE